MPLTDEQLQLKLRLLRHRSAVLRAELGGHVDQLTRPWRDTVERARRVGEAAGRHPWLLVGAAAALLLWKPRVLWLGLRWAPQALKAWRLLQARKGDASPPSDPSPPPTGRP